MNNGGWRLGLVLAAWAMVAGCNTTTPCDSIKVGDTVEQDPQRCFAGPGLGTTLTGTCSDAGTWTCAVASPAHDSYAAQCTGLMHCGVELDSAGKVMCVRHFCED
jgi:hypothetical protein